MNNCKRVCQKLYRLKSKVNQLKASFHNQGIVLVNRLVFGQSILQEGQVIYSPGGSFKYEVIGPCCRLFDRETLPWPSCSLQWKGKQPSWRRIGKRFVPQSATNRHPSYMVRLLGQDNEAQPQILTAYWLPLSAQQQEWWHSRKPQTQQATANSNHPVSTGTEKRASGRLIQETA